MRAIVARPLVYTGHVLNNMLDIFLADTSLADETLANHWSWTSLEKSRELGWRDNFRRFVVPPTPEQQAAYPYLALLDSIYQPARTAALVLALFVAGTVMAVLTPHWRPILAVVLTALGLIGIHAATVGAVPRYRVSVEPLIDVVAIGALVVLVTWGVRRFRRQPAG